MAHMIEEFDRGVCECDTWHKVKSYKVVGRPVTYEEALDVMAYPLVKAPLYANVQDRFVTVPKANCVVRTDHNIVIAPFCGDDFTLLTNDELLNRVKETYLDLDSEAKIESVGTLMNGRVCFLNVRMDERRVKGDDSPVVSRLMYYNPLGMGSYSVCAHSVRIVCMNTLKMAESQGAANKTLQRFRHTKGAADKIGDALAELAGVKSGIEEHFEMLNALSGTTFDSAKVQQFLEVFVPIADGGSKHATTLAQKARDALLARFEVGQDLKKKHTAYGMLQAVTYVLDHDEPKRGNDTIAVAWDGMVGGRSNKKEHALAVLQALAA
jgi:phage/plasmid-like protein (TIGR03299 family)